MCCLFSCSLLLLINCYYLYIFKYCLWIVYRFFKNPSESQALTYHLLVLKVKCEWPCSHAAVWVINMYFTPNELLEIGLEFFRHRVFEHNVFSISSMPRKQAFQWTWTRWPLLGGRLASSKNSKRSITSKPVAVVKLRWDIEHLIPTLHIYYLIWDMIWKGQKKIG